MPVTSAGSRGSSSGCSIPEVCCDDQGHVGVCGQGAQNFSVSFEGSCGAAEAHNGNRPVWLRVDLYHPYSLPLSAGYVYDSEVRPSSSISLMACPTVVRNSSNCAGF